MSKTGFFKLRLIKSSSKLFIKTENLKVFDCIHLDQTQLWVLELGMLGQTEIWLLAPRGVFHGIGCVTMFEGLVLVHRDLICQMFKLVNGCRTNYNWRIFA
jgi:hypothetical protein